MNRERGIKTGDVVYLGLVFLLAYLTGCSGVEFITKTGFYEVTKRDESVTTETRNTPFRCRFVPCSKEVSAYDK